MAAELSKFSIFLTGAFFMASLAACQAEIKSVAPTLKPNPTEMYDMTVTVEGAPGQFIAARGSHRFQVRKLSCLPQTFFTGVPAVAWGMYHEVAYRQTAPNTFVARVTLDKYIPHDDYGLGVCEWAPNVLSAELSNGINEHSISISAPREMTHKRAYRKNLFEYYSEKNKGSINGFDPEYHKDDEFSPDEFFFITLSAKKVTP
jgi:hypothetical protein